MYKIVLADLDFTILDDNRNVSADSIEAVKKIQSKNVMFGICTGRSYMSMQRFCNILDLNKKGNICVCYNGSTLYEPYSGKIISEKKIPYKYAIQIINFLRSFNVDIIAYDTDKVLAEKHTPRIDEYMRMSVLEPMIFNRFEDYIKSDVTKILIKADETDLQKVADSFKETDIADKVLTFYSSKDLFEFNPLNVDKGSGVKDLSACLNIPLNEIITIGDNYNDISMLKTAGLGVAVANANPDVKSAADYIAESDNNHCVLEEIYRKFILGRP